MYWDYHLKVLNCNNISADGTQESAVFHCLELIYRFQDHGEIVL